MQTQSLELRFTLTLDSTSKAHLTELFLTAIEVLHESKLCVPRTSLKPPLDPPEPTRVPESSSSEQLISAKQVAEFLNVSLRTVWRMQSGGHIPKAIHIGRAVRWNFEEIKAWTKAGCPSRVDWSFATS